MLQQTLSRLDDLEHASPIVVCNEEHRFLVAEQLRQLSVDSPTIILEPEGRNTAPAIALAAQAASKMDPDATLLVLPADHYVGKPDALLAAIGKAEVAAMQGKLVTFGLVPSQPETGYDSELAYYLLIGRQAQFVQQNLTRRTAVALPA